MGLIYPAAGLLKEPNLEVRKMSTKTKKSFKALICAEMVALALLVCAREVKASIVEVTDVQIIRGEIVEGWFQAIEVVDEIIVGDVFVITPEVTNLGSETEYVLNLYGWDLSPENRVEVIGTSGLCATYHDLQPGESTVLLPFCLEQAFKAQETGCVTMNIYVKDWVFEHLCQYTFEFTVIPEPATILSLCFGLLLLKRRTFSDRNGLKMRVVK